MTIKATERTFLEKDLQSLSVIPRSLNTSTIPRTFFGSFAFFTSVF